MISTKKKRREREKFSLANMSNRKGLFVTNFVSLPDNPISFIFLLDYYLITSSLSSTPLDSFSTQPVNVSSYALSLLIIFTGMVVFSIHLSSAGL